MPVSPAGTYADPRPIQFVSLVTWPDGLLVGSQGAVSVAGGSINIATASPIPVASITFDSLANLNIGFPELLAGEDTTVGVIKTEERFGYTMVSGTTSYTIKTGQGMLHALTLNALPSTAASIGLYDSTSVSGTAIALINTQANAYPPTTLIYDVTFVNGLTVGYAAASVNVTVSWR